MNLYKKDYKNLYLLQNSFLDWWGAFGLAFYLTGGTALGRFYLNHRYSEDLDFFVNADPNFSKHILFIKNELQSKFNTDITKTIVTEEFARFFIDDKDTFLKVEFVNDVAYRPDNPIKNSLGKIDTVTNILSNKLTAIVGRDEPKDIFDIVTIATNYSFNWQVIFNYAKEKAMINEIDVEQRLFTFPVKMLLNVDWLNKPLDIKFFESQIRKIADDFILGKNNSLGSNKIKIENAKILPWQG
ncbi:MAG: nucleotidyl transferase AbiEii/AbiGii toxin family protein [Bacteroidales bacterium]|nr:nucleotidyl transferase AbiEii/AbiGii toxin family protein [Bacteroidales bacterium]